MRIALLILFLASSFACRHPPVEPPATLGHEGFFRPAAVTEALLESRGLPLSPEIIEGVRARVAKLIIPRGIQRTSEAELLSRRTRECSTPEDRAWNGPRCAGYRDRDCDADGCGYEAFGNCSGLLAGEGLFVTAAHCVAELLEDSELAARAFVLAPSSDGPRRMTLGRMVAFKRDHAHDWVAIEEDAPVDLATIEVDDGGLPPFPRGPVPPAGDPVFIVGFPRVEGRAPNAVAEGGYEARQGTPSVSLGRIDDPNPEGRPLCNVDGRQEHWALAAPCPSAQVNDTFKGVLLTQVFTAPYDTINGYSGGPVFDAEGRWVGVNSTLISQVNPQEAYRPDTRPVATKAASLAIWPKEQADPKAESTP